MAVKSTHYAFANSDQSQFNGLTTKIVTPEESQQAIGQRFSVFSMAGRADNILMWSHYADQHPGTCIEFGTELHPQAFPYTHAVEYAEASPVIENRFANFLMDLRDRESAPDDELMAIWQAQVAPAFDVSSRRHIAMAIGGSEN